MSIHYWRGSCNAPAIMERTGAPLIISLRTEGERDVSFEDQSDFAFTCPACKAEHTALRITEQEYRQLEAEDEEYAGIVPDFVVDGMGEWAGPPEELLTVDVMKVTPMEEDDFTTVGINCSWCDEDIAVGQEVMLWGEPFGKFVAIKTFDKDECLKEVLDQYREKEGKKAMLIRYKS